MALSGLDFSGTFTDTTSGKDTRTATRNARRAGIHSLFGHAARAVLRSPPADCARDHHGLGRIDPVARGRW